MKTSNFLIGIGILALGAILLRSLVDSQCSSHQEVLITSQSGAVVQSQPLLIVFAQDVSKSIEKQGVEPIASSAIFEPIYAVTDRQIDLYFGFISGQSSKKLLHLSLSAQQFSRPAPLEELEQPDFIEEQRRKKTYRKAVIQYESDSVIFWQDRQRRIRQFDAAVEIQLRNVRDSLSNATDLITMISIADKVFNQSTTARKILVLNSDGQDSRGNTINSMQNDVTVLLTGANGLHHTSIDRIITKKLESPEDAISYIITHKN